MRKPPYPPSPSPKKLKSKMMGAARSMKVDPTDYMGPKKKKPSLSGTPVKPTPKRSTGIGETVKKPAKKKVNSGSTSARIRNMEKKYRRKLMEK
jgi:hypothetical protein